MDFSRASGGSDARQKISSEEFRLVIVNCPLRDEFGTDTAIAAAEHSIAGIIMIVKAELADDISEKVGEYGIYVIPKPLNRMLFGQSIKMAAATNSRMSLLRDENTRLQKKINELKYINQAKYLLISKKNLSEDDAHKYIEKRAMDTRRSRIDVAMEIIAELEDD